MIHQTTAPQAQLLRCRGAILEFLRSELKEQETCARNAWIRKTRAFTRMPPKRQLRKTGIENHDGPETKPMGLKLKDHVVENRLLWAHMIFWIAKIALWPLKPILAESVKPYQVRIKKWVRKQRGYGFLAMGHPLSSISVGHIRYQTCTYIYIYIPI